MKFLIAFAVLAYASAASVDSDFAAPIVKQAYDIQPDGAFQYVQESGNGIFSQAEGVVKNPNSEYPSLEIKGAYSYKAPDGSPIQVSYVADENGFQPQGSHLPVAPPVPEAILRSLAYIEAHPPKPSTGVGSSGPVYG